MGMFGRGSAKASYNPGASAQGPLSLADRARIFAVALQDPAAAAGMKQRLRLQPQQDAFMADLIARTKPGYSEGPDVQVSVPEAGQTAEVPQFQLPQRNRDPIDINSPDLPGLSLQAQRLGVPMTGLLDVLKAQQPDVRFDRGQGYNGKTGAAMGGFHPDLDKGIRPGADGGVEMVPGYDKVAAGIEGAKTGAQEQAKAGFDMVSVKIGGREVQLPRSVALPLITQAFAKDNPDGLPAGFGTSASPAETEADKAKALAGAGADIDLPRTLGNAAQAVSLIEQMKGHGGLDSRTGWRSAIPALPGTPGADFQAMADQLKGKVFLEAFGSLKGAGQITEVEGKKATDAIGRLSQSQTKEGYLKALQDLEDVINLGASRASGQAQRLQPAGAHAPGRPSGPSTTGHRSRIISVD